MNDKQAFKLIGERTRELLRQKSIQEAMLKITNEKGKEEAERWIYRLAIGTLMI